MPTLLLVANTDWYLYNFRLSLAQRARAEGYEVVLVSPSGKFVASLEKAGFRWVEWSVGRQTASPGGEWQAVKRLLSIYRAEHPDIVHQFTIKPVLYGSLCARWAQVPKVVNSITGLGYVFLQNHLKARVMRVLARAAYRALLSRPGTSVIFENSTDRNFFIQSRMAHEENSYLIEGVGVDPEQYSPAPEPGGIPLVIQASRLLWDKGVGVLADASRMLRQEGCRVRIALVGEPDPGNPASVDRETLGNWVREGVLEWWGFQQDMPAVYQGCHIVTLPSMREGLPTALIEAAACGKPLVATDVPGCRDVVQDGVNGFLVPNNDPAALAGALRKLASDPALRAQFGAASRLLALERFTDETILSQTIQVYQAGNSSYPTNKQINK